jgi:uncharacterized protein with GYD domain
MTVYMYQASYTAKSMAAQLTEPHDPMEAIRPTLEELGAKILVAGFPFGEYDVLVVYEAPDDMTAASVAMAIAAAGEVKSGKTTRLLSGQEWLESLRKRRIVNMRKGHSSHDPHAQLPELLWTGYGPAMNWLCTGADPRVQSGQALSTVPALDLPAPSTRPAHCEPRRARRRPSCRVQDTIDRLA